MNDGEESGATITDVQTTIIEGNFPWTLVRIYTDEGTYGTGEAVLGPKADAYIDHAKQFLIGESPLDIDARMSELYARLAHHGGISGVGVTAASALDIALHDLAGKLLGVPAYRLLGGKHRDSVRVYCDTHAGAHLHEAADEAESEEFDDPYAPEAFVGAAEEVLEEGFDAIKFDLDAGHRFEGDMRNSHLSNKGVEYRRKIVEGVTEAVGDRADVAFDCHWSWNADSVGRLASAVSDYDVWWLEDTVPPENHDVQIEVTRNVDTTIAAGENVYRAQGARRLLENQGLDVIHPDVPKNGGMLEAKKIADMAKTYYIPLALHNVSSPIGTMASAHVAASASNFLALEYHARDVPWWGDLVGEELIEDGEIEVPDEPGLGVELDRGVAKEHLAEGETLFQ